MGVNSARARDAKRHMGVFLLAVASLWPFYVAYQCRNYLNDDAYISLTYAKCIAEGRGFVFNGGPASLGTTTPLFTLLVAGIGRVVPDCNIGYLAVVLSAVCWVACAWTVYGFRVPLRLSQRQAVLIGLVFLLSGWWSLGAETYLFQLLLFLSAGLFLRGSWLVTGFCVGLLFLTRGEGCLVLAVLGVTLLARLILTASWPHSLHSFRLGTQYGARMDIVKAGLYLALGFLIPVSLWALYAYATFGHILPNTLGVKIAQGDAGMIPTFASKVVFWARWWWHRPISPALTYAYWSLAVLGLARISLTLHPWIIFPVWAMVYALGYTVLGVGAYYWYQYPLYAVWITFVALGLDAVVGGLDALRKWRPRLALPAHAVFLVLVLLVMAFHLQMRPVWPYSPRDGRASTYLATAEWLRRNVEPTRNVAASEVGYLGFFTNNRIIDLCGLVTREITPFVLKGDYITGFWVCTPDYFVNRATYTWLDPLVSSQRFREAYAPVVDIQGQETDITLTIYKLMNPPTIESIAR